MISDFDLAILLGNALENACHAAAKAEPDKFIELKIVTKNAVLLIVVRNSFNGQVVNKDGIYYSAKRDFAEPGMGFQSIDEIVKKLDGYMSVDTTNQIFTVSMAITNKGAGNKDEVQIGGKDEYSNL